MRRGRNNRMLFKFVDQSMFTDNEDGEIEEKKEIGKRKIRKYESILNYFQTLYPEIGVASRYQCLRD
jgi:hypothetical protein